VGGRVAPLRAAAATLTLAAVVTCVVACRAGDRPHACPAPWSADPDRAGALVERLRATDDGAALLAGLAPRPLPALCFGRAGPSSVTTEGVILLEAALDDGEAAARVGHLLQHVVEGLPMAHPHPGDCDAQVGVALVAEARSLSLELRLRRALGVRAPRLRYPFEGAFWAAPAARREADVLDFLRAHPDGAPGLDALAAGYARRCREAR